MTAQKHTDRFSRFGEQTARTFNRTGSWVSHSPLLGSLRDYSPNLMAVLGLAGQPRGWDIITAQQVSAAMAEVVRYMMLHQNADRRLYELLGLMSFLGSTVVAGNEVSGGSGGRPQENGHGSQGK